MKDYQKRMKAYCLMLIIFCLFMLMMAPIERGKYKAMKEARNYTSIAQKYSKGN